MINLTGPHLVLIVAVADVVGVGVLNRHTGNIAAAHLIGGDSGLVGVCHDPRGKEALHQCGHQFGFRVAPQLEQHFNDRGQIRHAAVLVRALAVHDVQNVRQAGLPANGLNALPLGLLLRNLAGVGVSNPVGHGKAAAVHLHAVIDFVAIVGVLALGDVRPTVHDIAAGVRGADAVSLHQMQPQRVGVQLCGLLRPLDKGEHITAHQPAFQGQLLQSVKVVHAQRVTVAAVLRPQSELGLRLALPLFGCFRGQSQHIAVNGRFQRQAGAHNLGAVRVDGACRNGAAHIQHAAALAQCGVILVYILARRIAVGPKTARGPPCKAAAGVAVSACLRCAGLSHVAQVQSPP